VPPVLVQLGDPRPGSGKDRRHVRVRLLEPEPTSLAIPELLGLFLEPHEPQAFLFLLPLLDQPPTIGRGTEPVTELVRRESPTARHTDLVGR
jgi:hypothetical protein